MGSEMCIRDRFECNEDMDSFKLDDGTAYDERVLMSAAARQQEQ